MKKLLVHLHLYYHEQVDYFISKLRNISGIEWSLWVTYSQPDEESFTKLSSFKEDVNFMQVENIGYDIWPFIKLIKSLNLKDYDYVMKLHTKRHMGSCRPNIIKFRGYDWRNALVDALLRDPEQFKKVLDKFEKDPKTGMMSSFLTRVTRDYFHPEVKAELKRIGLNKKGKYTCMGTMFMMRAEPLEKLKDPIINDSLFRNDKPISGTYFQNAHLYERIFSHLPVNYGLKFETICPDRKTFYKVKMLKMVEPLGKLFFTCQREGRYRQKIIRVFRIKVYQEKININKIGEYS